MCCSGESGSPTSRPNIIAVPANGAPIADANDIEDPRRLNPGIFLAIPPLP